MKTFPLFKKLIISSTLLLSAMASAQSESEMSLVSYKVNEIIPVQTGDAVAWRNWRGEYVKHLVGQEYYANNMARSTYLKACSDTAVNPQFCEMFYQDSALVKYVFLAHDGVCAERGEGREDLCVGDLVRPATGSVALKVVGMGSGAHFNSKTGKYSRYALVKELEHSAATQKDTYNINDLMILNR